MAETARKQNDPHPLERLGTLLDSDMRAVNAIILGKMQSPVEIIPQLAGHLIAAGGKRIRPLLTLACTRLYGYEGDRPYRLAASVEFIHTATLLHDDVVDDSGERRGRPSANAVFGNLSSILVGDFLFSRAFQLMVDDGSLEVLRILSDASAIIAQGEVMQMMTTGNIKTTFEDYEEVVKAKTAALFAAACEIGPIIAGEDTEAASAMCEYGMNLGIAFQIADDVLDYSAQREKLGKTIGDDFREGKVTAPVLIALSEADDNERAFWARVLAGEEAQSESDLARAQAILAKHDACSKGMTLARTYADKALCALQAAPAGDLRNALADIAGFAVEREY
ncbi:MAG: polyprenyl synthetase family protein [Alphaproteobacteria bacterium]|nr:polyprenyl synthetase family protein [Alphaproteobacteria bacterium]